MNKRLKELYKQARCVDLSTDDFVLEDWEKKFVELVVKECISVIDPNTGIKPYNKQTQEEFWKNQAVYLIKQHFSIPQFEASEYTDLMSGWILKQKKGGA